MESKALTTTTERLFLLICFLCYIAWREVSLIMARPQSRVCVKTEEAERNTYDMEPGHSSRRATIDKAARTWYCLSHAIEASRLFKTFIS